MYRSSSTIRVPDDHFHSTSSKISPILRAVSLEGSELPIYESLSEIPKKEKSQAKFAENAIHLIPLILLLCCFTLWILSNPNIDAKGDAIGANSDGMTIDGDLESDTAAHLPVDLGDHDPAGNLRDTNSLFSRNRV